MEKQPTGWILDYHNCQQDFHSEILSLACLPILLLMERMLLKKANSFIQLLLITNQIEFQPEKMNKHLQEFANNQSMFFLPLPLSAYLKINIHGHAQLFQICLIFKYYPVTFCSCRIFQSVLQIFYRDSKLCSQTVLLCSDMSMGC